MRGMLKAVALLGVGVIVCTSVVSAQKTSKKPPTVGNVMEMDKPVKEFKLKNLAHETKEGEKKDANLVAIKELKKPVVMFFMSEKCGVTWKYEKRIGDLVAKYGEKDVAFVSIRCSANDTEESIVKFAEAKNFNMPVLNDAKGELTSFFRVRQTPTFVVLDKKGVLRYHGSFDDNAEVDAVEHKYLAEAVSAVLADKDVPVKKTAPFG